MEELDYMVFVLYNSIKIKQTQLDRQNFIHCKHQLKGEKRKKKIKVN